MSTLPSALWSFNFNTFANLMLLCIGVCTGTLTLQSVCGVLIFCVHFAHLVSSATAARLLTNYQETNRVDLWDKVKFQFDQTSYIIHVSHFY